MQEIITNNVAYAVGEQQIAEAKQVDISLFMSPSDCTIDRDCHIPKS